MFERDPLSVVDNSELLNDYKMHSNHHNRVDSDESFERKLMEMETSIRKQQTKKREVDDEGFTNYTDFNLSIMKKQKESSIKMKNNVEDNLDQ